MTRKCKRYSNQFKVDKVKLILEQGYKITKAAKNLDIFPDLLRRWKAEYEGNQQITFDKNSSQIPEQESPKKKIFSTKQFLKQVLVKGSYGKK